MLDRIFTFKSGYTIGVKAEYMQIYLDAAMQGWQAEHPIPEMPKVPMQKVKAKGGFREIQNPFDAQYLAEMETWKENIQLWQAMFEKEKASRKVELAIDPTSIDTNVVKNARKEFDSRGWHAEPDDVKFYLNLVADMGRGSEGDKDFRISEIVLLNRFIDEEKGPPGALIEHLLRTTFRNSSLEQKAESTRINLGSSSETGETAES